MRLCERFIAEEGCLVANNMKKKTCDIKRQKEQRKRLEVVFYKTNVCVTHLGCHKSQNKKKGRLDLGGLPLQLK